MADEVIWNVDRTVAFLAHEFQAARTTFSPDKDEYWVRIHLKGSIIEKQSKYTGLWYETHKTEKEAKACLTRLIEKLIRAGVIKEPKDDSGNRFDHVDLQGGE